ncbi:MAG: hypothetical protein SVT52_01425 [Planctomycetota bacterium]|nr:hypothetical protein [Planctomycetota bacterium]
MAATVETTASTKTASRCTLCPAGCQLQPTAAGPDAWRVEYPAAESAGLCPRGSTLGELLGHRRRILLPGQRVGGQLRQVGQAAAVKEIVNAAAGKGLTILLAGNLPSEQIAAVAETCRAWPEANLSIVIEPAEQQMLLGLEASGAKYLTDAELAQCDGFVIIGDAFAANPRCSRAILDCRKTNPRTPIVVIDSASGLASKFATHRLSPPAGMELQALAALVSAAGIETDESSDRFDRASAASAGAAIAGCKRLGVLLAAQYGRSNAWQSIGRLAGRLANARPGGVAPQTDSANTLVAVRLAAKYQTIPLAKALADTSTVRIALGCDVLGMLGLDDNDFFAAAAPLPNRTTDAARVVLPMAMACELGGTHMFAGEQACCVAPLLPGPLGVLSPAELVGELAKAAGAAVPAVPAGDSPLKRVDSADLKAAAPLAEASGLTLLLGRQTWHAGCGELTAWGSWQAAQELPELRLSPAEAQKIGVENLATVTVEVSSSQAGRSLQARVRLDPTLSPGIAVLPEACAAARALNPSEINGQAGTVTAVPVGVSVSH